MNKDQSMTDKNQTNAAEAGGRSISDKSIIMIDSPEAATYHENISGWVARNGIFLGKDERSARYSGCTHVYCKACNAPAEKLYTLCGACREKDATDRFYARPEVEWDGKCMIFSDAYNTFWNSLEDAEDSLDDGATLEDMRLLECVPNYAHIEEDQFSDALDPDGDAPSELTDAIEAFNEAVKNVVLSWSPGKRRIKLSEAK